MELVKKRYQNARAKGSFKQLGTFGLVGLLNTALDFGIFNACTLLLHMPPVPANVVSTSFAQVASFLLNRKFVFKQDQAGSAAKAMLRFVAVTAIGLYVIQNITIYVFAHVVTLPGDAVVSILHGLGFTRFDETFVILNTAKVIATVFSAAWNFAGYKKIVFSPARR